MSINEIGLNEQIFFNLQKTKEIDLIILSKEKKEREQEKHPKKLDINDFRKLINSLPNELHLYKLHIDISNNENNDNNNNKNPENSSKEDLSKKVKKFKKFNELIIVNIDSFIILKTFWKLYYSLKVFYIILFLNIFLPGVGTIIAGIGWGKTCQYKNRTCELIIRGIFQFLTFFLIFGWIQSIRDANNYFVLVK